MDLAKKIISYMIILLGLAIVAGLVSASYLYLVPNSQIFGFYFISGSGTEFYDNYTEHLSEYEIIEVDTYKFNVEVFPQEDDLGQVQVTFTNNAVGFANSGETEFSYAINYDSVTKTIHISTVEPTSGLILYTDASLRVGFPNISSEKEIIVNSHGGSVTLGTAGTVLETNDITITNGKAAMAIQNFTMNSASTLSITNGAGITNIFGNVAGNVVIDSEIGSFNFANDAQTYFYNVGGDLNILGDNPAVKVGDVAGDVSVYADNGLLYTGTIDGGLTITTVNGEATIDKVMKNVTITSGYNTITINSIGEAESSLYQASINSDNGNIEIGDCYYELHAEADRGSITVLNAYYDTYIQTTYGDVIVNYALDANLLKNIEQADSFKTLEVTTTEGNITATNLRTLTSLAVAESSTAQIIADFLVINGHNTIVCGRRESIVRVPIDEHTLNVYTQSGDVNIQVGSAYKTSWQSSDLIDHEVNTTAPASMTYGYTVQILSGGSANLYVDNTLSVQSTTGKINVLTNENTLD
ncbi:MAG: hypothetical protein AB7S44_02025 [Spirochaetales bacterium]